MPKEYPAEFKAKIIKRYQKGESIQSLSQELHIAQSTLYDWRREYCSIKTANRTYTPKEFDTLSRRLEKLEHIEATISPHFSLVNAGLRSAAAPRGFSSSVSSWRVAPFYSWEKEKSSRFKIEMAAPGSWCLCCVVVTQQFLF